MIWLVCIFDVCADDDYEEMCDICFQKAESFIRCSKQTWIYHLHKYNPSYMHSMHIYSSMYVHTYDIEMNNVSFLT